KGFVGRCRRGQPIADAGKRVEHRQMRGRIEQCLMFVLTVQLDQMIGALLQRRRRNERAVDERAAPALCGDFPSYQQFLTVVLEDGFDGGGFLPGSYEIAGRPAAKEKTDRFNED